MRIRSITPGYSVSDTGRVFNDLTGKELSPYKGDRAGHLRVDIGGRQEYVHRLVAQAFHGDPPPGFEACHNDGDPTNNYASNIRWDTRAANVLDMRADRTMCPRGHEFTESNSYYTAEGWRRCRECKRRYR
ncbi:HNH endonuclease signature motif containing protein [Glutamicibacter protophormiae]|uniref:HNH endonuclease signature motif containing protein n=1 Tax=Glutamicibacter protophormiae TaxID=37930 RepID=UPI003A8E499A